MTIIEMILALAIIILTGQILILQRYYNDKLSEQALVLGYLIDVIDKSARTKQLDKIRERIFNSSQ